MINLNSNFKCKTHQNFIKDAAIKINGGLNKIQENLKSNKIENIRDIEL